MTRTSSAEAGFTLAELIVVMVLIGIIAASTATLVLQGTQVYGDLIARKEALHHPRLALERVSREVRLASAVGLSSCQLNITTTNRGVINVFRDAATNTVRIGGTGQPAGGSILADGISYLCFSIQTGSTPSWVEMTLTVASGLTYRTKAYLRKGIFYPN